MSAAAPGITGSKSGQREGNQPVSRPGGLGFVLAIAGLAACGHSSGKPADLQTGSPTVADAARLFPSARDRLPPMLGASATPPPRQFGITGVLRSGDWVDVQWNAPAGSTASVAFTPQGGRPQLLIAGSTAASWSFTTSAAHGVVRVEAVAGKRRWSFQRPI